MSNVSSHELKPRNGRMLKVGIGCRISGCANQKEQSLQDQEDSAKEVVESLYKGSVEYIVIATKGKGEALDRPELQEVEEHFCRGELDLFIWDDLGRLIRGYDAVRLLGLGVDHGTRTIVPDDCIDTADVNWEEDALNACAAHVAHNAQASKRIKKKLMNRFVTLGGVLAREIYGYVKPPGSKTYHDLQRLPEATPIYQEMFRRLRETLNQEKVADWLNAQDVPLGKYSRKGKQRWTGKDVARLRRNPLLKGRPGRGFRRTVKVHTDGRRKSRRNPDGPKFSHHEFPHLVHVNPMEFDAVNALLNAHNEGMGRKPVNGSDPRAGISRHKTRCPGQHATCWYCGWKYIWGGNGVNDHLMCPGSRNYTCWNSIGFSGPLAVKKLNEIFIAQMYEIEGLDTRFRELVRVEANSHTGGAAERQTRLKRELESLAHEQANLAAVLAEYGPTPFLKPRVEAALARQAELEREQRSLESLSSRTLRLPESTAALRAQLEAQLFKLSAASYEYGDLMKKLVPEFHVYLVRLCDGGHLYPRARVKLSLLNSIDDAKHTPVLVELLSREHTVDLFIPPQRERIREAAVRLHATGLEQRKIGVHSDLSEPATQTAVSDALSLNRRMRDLGLLTPYVVVSKLLRITRSCADIVTRGTSSRR